MLYVVFLTILCTYWFLYIIVVSSNTTSILYCLEIQCFESVNMNLIQRKTTMEETKEEKTEWMGTCQSKHCNQQMNSPCTDFSSSGARERFPEVNVTIKTEKKPAQHFS